LNVRQCPGHKLAIKNMKGSDQGRWLVRSAGEFSLSFVFILQYDEAMKRWALVLPLFALAVFPACMSWFLEQPTFALKEVAITRLSLTDIHFRFGIEVQNPNSFDMDLRALEYTIYFNDRQVGRGRLDKEVRIAKTSATLVQVPLQTDFKSLGDPLGLVRAGQDLKYKIEGAAIVKASLGTATIPFSKTGEVRIKK